ncbi:MAG TPA: hypothetical protein VMT20_30560, partial [Terriglobia bacterium]|nr:hypothetical protein [Terriglobia bacterium]
MTNPNEPRKPKRSCTVTERVLAACRVNIKKAQAAALERRFCATRGTDAEHNASHASLEAAQRVKREDRTYKYCSCFRHGLLVADLERSLFMAGESREEYHAHLARFAALPAALACDADSEEVKLAQACGYASWRRLRAFRLHSEWSLRMMVHHLRKAIGARQAGSGEGEASLGGFRELVELGELAGFGETLQNPGIWSATQSSRLTPSAAQSGPVISSAAALSGAARNLALKTGAMPDSALTGWGLPAAPGNDRLNECFPSPVGQSATLTPEQFLELGRGLRWAAESWPGVWQPITRLNNRFDQLWCTLLHQLGEPVPSLSQYFLECAHMRWSPVVGRFDLYSAEVLGNPLLRTRRLEELLES